MGIRYITKSGEMLFYSTDSIGSINFDKWVHDRLEHENGLFPYDKGYISADAILRIDPSVTVYPKYRDGREALRWILDDMDAWEGRDEN